MKQTDLEKLLADMSLKEKVDQMLQLSGAFYLGDENSVLTGPANDMGIGKEDLEMAGSILGAAGADTMKKLQDDYMAKQPHHIPMLFMMDVIHGMKTIFPAPLAQGATFDPELSGECASAAAKEASAAGLHVTFSPMVDLVRDARWGRVVESTGEDPYLNSRFSEAIVKGFQGDDLKTPGKVASCIKHFAGYGGAVAGRDYNTVELSEHTFREFYLPAYKAGIDAGAAMVMTSFNTINGVPASTNKWLMRDILRGEMGFDGVLISDFAAILETVAHRSSKDAADAAKKALEAGVDIDMMTSVYAANLCRLVEEGEVDEHLIDECCLRILELKNKLGLFENPYKDADAEKEKAYSLCPEHRTLAKKAAEESFVLLKNDGVLPLDTAKKIAFIGPYDEYDALAIPGGFGEFGFYEEAYDERFLKLIKEFNAQGKIIAAVCSGAFPVAKSGVLQNRKGTTYHLKNGYWQNKLKELGVNVVNEPVVVDGNIITSYCPETAPKVAFELLKMLTSEKEMEVIKKAMGF